jgi:3-hydroxy-9,10-secoandrosta-1,3,5(10)-triene-9,17-dione monooxygenase reductase component
VTSAALPADSGFDAAEFRKALGSFATGVTIITTRAPDGAPVGLTANSFNSVSLNPPLVLWSLAETSLSLPAFRAAEHWAVHVLASDQEELSGRFARRGQDKFAGLEVDSGRGGVPLLRGCAARFQCRKAFQYQGGDHLIFVGEVLDFDRAESAPLVFHGGRYAHATRREASDRQPRNAWLEGSFNEGFLGYLLGRGHFQFFARVRPFLEQERLSDEEFYLLSTLTLKRRLDASQVDEGLNGVADPKTGAAMQALIGRGFVQPEVSAAGTPVYQLTEAGAACALRLISAAKAVESQIIDQLGGAEAAALKSLLNRLIHLLDPEVEQLWSE